MPQYFDVDIGWLQVKNISEKKIILAGKLFLN